MINDLLQITAPHICCGCDRTGSVLCNDCKNNITFDKPVACLMCLGPSNSGGLCDSCRLKHPYSKAWFVGIRKDEIERLIDSFKFKRVKSAHEACS